MIECNGIYSTQTRDAKVSTSTCMKSTPATNLFYSPPSLNISAISITCLNSFFFSLGPGDKHISAAQLYFYRNAQDRLSTCDSRGSSSGGAQGNWQLIALSRRSLLP